MKFFITSAWNWSYRWIVVIISRIMLTFWFLVRSLATASYISTQLQSFDVSATDTSWHRTRLCAVPPCALHLFDVFEQTQLVRLVTVCRFRHCSPIDAWCSLNSHSPLSTSISMAALLGRLLACILSLDTESSRYLSSDRRRAFMKKLATVETLRPSWSAIVACISLFGLRVSLKMASNVRRWISVKTRRGFLWGMQLSCRWISCSRSLQAANYI